MTTASAEPAVRLFPLEAVSLRSGPFFDAAERNITYLLAHDADRLLAPFRREAGLAPRAQPYPNWEDTGLDGHTAGHYLTALAQVVATTHHPEARERLEYMLGELRACQEAYGDGYIGGVPGSRALWTAIAEGTIDAGNFSLNGRWVPWYNLHKTYAGLRDAWLLTNNPDARNLLIGLVEWTHALVADLDDAQLQDMLRSEHGGMNEVLADTAAITGDPRHLELADRFSDRAILEPLLRREDQLTGLHANTQIPKAIGYGRIGEMREDSEWIDAAVFFWETVVENRTVAIGGNSVREHFHPSEDFSPMIESREGPETCNTYNMLRLTEQLFQRDPDPRYAAYYERALYNHILSTQHPEHGGYVYFTPMRPRHYRVYSQPEHTFWCCVGSGMENHGRYGQFIYAHTEDALLVNLFIDSEVNWAERGVTLRQETRFPTEEQTSLKLTLAQPATFALRIRIPDWVQPEKFAVQVNGQRWNAPATPDSYLTIKRQWQDGDTVSVDLPMTLALDHLADGTDYAAVRYGPIVLAAAVDGETPGLLADSARMAHVADGPYLPLDQAPMLVGDPKEILDALQPIDGKPLHFKATGAIRPESFADLELVPFFTLHDARYMLYWRLATPETYEAVVASIAEQEAERMRIEARTLDQVTPGEQQPEVEHALRGEGMDTGTHLGRRWRDAGNWFSYQLSTDGAKPSEISLTYYGGERDRRFKVLLNGELIATIHLEGRHHDQFIERRHEIPATLAEAAEEAPLEVKVVAEEGSRTARLFDLRVLRAE